MANTIHELKEEFTRYTENIKNQEFNEIQCQRIMDNFVGEAKILLNFNGSNEIASEILKTKRELTLALEIALSNHRKRSPKENSHPPNKKSFIIKQFILIKNVMKERF